MPGSLPDPKESCTRLQAKAFRVEKNFCVLKYFIYQSKAIIRFQLRDIFWWDQREPLENCTSLLNLYKNGLIYSQCQRRIYFACVRGKAVVPKKLHFRLNIILDIYKVRQMESNFQRQICLHLARCNEKWHLSSKLHVSDNLDSFNWEIHFTKFLTFTFHPLLC